MAILEVKRKVYFTDLSINGLVGKFGYRAPKYFSKLFKKHTEYRSRAMAVASISVSSKSSGALPKRIRIVWSEMPSAGLKCVLHTYIKTLAKQYQ